MGSKALTKGAMIRDIAAEHSLKAKEVSQIFDSLAAIATKEVKKTGVFTVPGLCRIKTKTKPASKDSCESIPSFCTQEADLSSSSLFPEMSLGVITGSYSTSCGNPTGESLGQTPRITSASDM